MQLRVCHTSRVTIREVPFGTKDSTSREKVGQAPRRKTCEGRTDSRECRDERLLCPRKTHKRVGPFQVRCEGVKDSPDETKTGRNIYRGLVSRRERTRKGQRYLTGERDKVKGKRIPMGFLEYGTKH